MIYVFIKYGFKLGLLYIFIYVIIVTVYLILGAEHYKNKQEENAKKILRELFNESSKK